MGGVAAAAVSPVVVGADVVVVPSVGGVALVDVLGVVVLPPFVVVCVVVEVVVDEPVVVVDEPVVVVDELVDVEVESGVVVVVVEVWAQ